MNKGDGFEEVPSRDCGKSPHGLDRRLVIGSKSCRCLWLWVLIARMARSIVVRDLPSAQPAESGGTRGAKGARGHVHSLPWTVTVSSISSSEHLNFQMDFQRVTTSRFE